MTREEIKYLVGVIITLAMWCGLTVMVLAGKIPLDWNNPLSVVVVVGLLSLTLITTLVTLD